MKNSFYFLGKYFCSAESRPMVIIYISETLEEQLQILIVLYRRTFGVVLIIVTHFLPLTLEWEFSIDEHLLGSLSWTYNRWPSCYQLQSPSYLSSVCLSRRAACTAPPLTLTLWCSSRGDCVTIIPERRGGQLIYPRAHVRNWDSCGGSLQAYECGDSHCESNEVKTVVGVITRNHSAFQN